MTYSARMCECAMRYAAAGWFVLPLQPRDKQPIGTLVPRGVLDATRDDKLIHKWFTSTNANIGIATGVNSKIWVLDIDGPVGALIWWDWEANNGHCFTLAQRTGRLDGGRQLFFRYPPTLIIKSQTQVMTKIDVRGDAGYIVAPPSIHPSGKRYRWEGKVPINDAPRKLLKLIGARKRPKPTSPPQDYAMKSSNYGLKAANELLVELSSCPRGGRDQLAFRVATRLLELEHEGSIQPGTAEETLRIGLSRCGYLDDPRKERGERGLHRIMNSARRRVG